MQGDSSRDRPPAAHQASPGTFRPQPASFARRDGRLNRRHQHAWDGHRGRFVLDVPRGVMSTSVAPEHALDQQAAFGRRAPLVVELGSGAGDAVLHAAAAHPDLDFLAVEVYRPGLAQTLARVVHEGVDNVRLVQADATDVLATMLAPGSVQEVWTFFPDPWPKARHHKRRLVTPALAALVSRVLRPGGAWRLASDWPDYATRIRDVTQACPDLLNPYAGQRAAAGDPLGGFAPRFEGRVETRFERKGLAAGRPVLDLHLVRR